MAEFVLKDMVKKLGIEDNFYIESAATSTEEIWNGVGNPVYPPAKEKMAENGIDCSGKQARQTTKADYNRFDHILVMDRNNMRNIKKIYGADPENKVRRLMDYTDRPGDVADQWYTGDFQATWDDVNDGCRGLLKAFGVEL